MDHQQRGSSPSEGHSSNQINLRHTPSPSPHLQPGPFQTPNQGLPVDQTGASFSSSNTSFGTQYQPTGQPVFAGTGQFDTNPGAYNQQPTFSQPGYLDSSLPEGITSGASFDPNNNNNNNNDNNIFGGLSANGFNNQLDPPLFGDLNQFTDQSVLDPSLNIQNNQSHSIGPSNLMNQMSTQGQTSPTPPHLLAPSMQHQRSSGSPQNSPGLQQSAFQPPPNHSRHTSLDPSSAAYPQNWNGMHFQHRRVPSDAHSDVSSVHASPYMGNVESYDGSPLLNAQQDPGMYQEVMGIGQFTLNDHQQQTNPYISPAHSPAVSPRLMPQQHMPSFTSADSYGMMNGGLAPTLGSNYNGQLEMFPDQGQVQFPDLSPGDTMSPPVIRFEPAPPSRQASFEPPQDEVNEGALSPPEGGRSRNRMRAHSDSALGQRARSTSGSHRSDGKDMLSPAAAGVGSRSPSPSGKSRRSSTSSVPNRDYLLGLADPSRSPLEVSTDGIAPTGSKRTQKHPATFQCSLCPKRFTRAYNLRSHLRTHTDERPFVCSVCGKAFARQHDRKRHESLHSGEKKFVCRGSLKEGGTWGCGRRFARADALGRHFRSEAGRVCIKPLLEEEALERQAREGVNNPGMLPGQFNAPLGFDAYGGMGAPTGQAWDPNMGGAPPMPFRLPTVLLQQYPTLGSIWDNMSNEPMANYEDDVGGRSSFDASGGEYDEDDYGGKSGWASDVGVYGTGS